MDPRILVAGVGNIFLGDDGFGVEVARRLKARAWPSGIVVADYGIRGMDLAFALTDEWAAIVLVDAAQRREPPGTLTLIEHAWDQERYPATIETHAMDLIKVFRLASELGANAVTTYIIACEPAVIQLDGYDDVVAELSEPVRNAVDGAVEMVEMLLERLTSPVAVPR